MNGLIIHIFSHVGVSFCNWPSFVLGVVGEAEEDRALARGLVTSSISTGHLWAQLPSDDLAASFRQTLGTAVRKGQQRITASICDSLDLEEEGEKIFGNDSCKTLKVHSRHCTMVRFKISTCSWLLHLNKLWQTAWFKNLKTWPTNYSLLKVTFKKDMCQNWSHKNATLTLLP